VQLPSLPAWPLSATRVLSQCQPLARSSAILMVRDSSVGKAAGYGLDGRTSIPGRRLLSVPQRPDRLIGPLRTSRAKRPGREADHSQKRRTSSCICPSWRFAEHLSTYRTSWNHMFMLDILHCLAKFPSSTCWGLGARAAALTARRVLVPLLPEREVANANGRSQSTVCNCRYEGPTGEHGPTGHTL
jgi:hypothetical protein